jgi:hypothetical protein
VWELAQKATKALLALAKAFAWSWLSPYVSILFLMTLAQRIHSEYLNLIHIFGLPLKPALIEISSSSTYWGEWNHDTRTLKISQKLIEQENWYHLLGVLKHEMAHQIVSEIYQSQDQHGPDFQRACQQIGVPVEFRHSKVDLQSSDLDWQNFHFDQELQNKLSKVEKLLALTSSDNPHEAQLALRKAQKMSPPQPRTQENQYFQKTLLKRKGNISRFEKELLHFLNEHYSVYGFIGNSYDFIQKQNLRTLEILGLRENIMIAEYVFQFLNRVMKEKSKLAGIHKKSFQSGFLSGFKKRYQGEELLQLVPIDPDLKNYVTNLYPQLRSRRISSSPLDSHSYSQGFEIGKKTEIHQPINKTTKTTSETKLIT